MALAERLATDYDCIVELADTSGEGDLTDWMADGSALDRITNTTPYVPPEPEPWHEPLLPVDEYPDPPPALVYRTDGPPVIPGHGKVMVMGPRGSGKSWIAVHIAAAALNRRSCGHLLPGRGNPPRSTRASARVRDPPRRGTRLGQVPVSAASQAG